MAGAGASSAGFATTESSGTDFGAAGDVANSVSVLRSALAAADFTGGVAVPDLET